MEEERGKGDLGAHNSINSRCLPLNLTWHCHDYNFAHFKAQGIQRAAIHGAVAIAITITQTLSIYILQACMVLSPKPESFLN
eukprot:351937-Chlamydomonas_euryale.AAC.1